MSDARTYAEKRKAIRMKERLIELLQDDDCPLLYVLGENVGTLADYLIANGVTVTIKKEKQPTDLSGKCGSCAFAKAECPSVYLRCTNPENISKWRRGRDRSLRQRTNPACKQYKPKE